MKNQEFERFRQTELEKIKKQQREELEKMK
jgi:hypothetical protein